MVNFADSDIQDELKKNPKQRRLKATEYLRPQVVEVWKEFQEMPDHVHY